jgi:hypothetical protein
MTRIYRTETTIADRVNGTQVRLIEAANKNQAVNFVAKDTIVAEVATQAQLIELTKAGIEVEKAQGE